MSVVIMFAIIMFLIGWNASNLYQEYVVKRQEDLMQELRNLKQLCSIN